MKNIVDDHIWEIRTERKMRLKYLGIILALAMAIASIVMWRFCYTGIALDNEIYHGIETHIHVEECYETIDVLICDIEESEGHTHTQDCYMTTTEKILTCDLEESKEHIHTEECFDENGNVICGLEETEGHIHIDECYEEIEATVLICEREEEDGHFHTEDCYINEQVLVCGKEEICEEATEELDMDSANESIDMEATESETEDSSISFNTEYFSAYTVTMSVDVLMSGECGENLIWTLMSDGVLTISGTGKMYDYNVGTTPWYSYRSEITSLVIETGVTDIGNYSFYYCFKLQSVSIADSVTSIGTNAFADSFILQNVIFDQESHLISIGNNAFKNCYGIESIELPAGVKSLGTYAFQNCISLKTFTFKEECSITLIPVGLFYGCTSLGYIVIPETVVSIGRYAFRDCSSLKKVSFEENSSLNIIYASAFYDCNSLIEIVIPNTVTTIQTTAFYRCKNLTSITIPALVTNIAASAFYECTGLTTVEFAEGSAVTSIGDTAFYGCISLLYINIPANVTRIGNQAFYGCSSLYSVTFMDPTILTSMGTLAFASCVCLCEVNEKNTVNDVIGIFTNISVDKSVFSVTKLYGITLSGAPDNDNVIVIGNIDTTGLKVEISVTKTGNVSSSVAKNEYYTGVPAYTSISVSSGSAEIAKDYVARIYIWFGDIDGELSLVEGTHTYINTPVYVHVVSGLSNLYCIEIKGSEWGGETISFDFNALYPNLTSDGGYAWIFGEVMKATEAFSDYWPTSLDFSYHEIIWKTEPSIFQVKKTGRDMGTFSGDGTGSEDVYLTNLIYDVDFAGTSVTTEGQGKDLITSVEFFDTLILPETLKWRDGLLEAVRQGNYYIYYSQYNVTANMYRNPSVYVTVEGDSCLLCTISNTGLNRNIYDISLAVENEKIVLHWTMKNTSAETEISLTETTLTFGDHVILVADTSILKSGTLVSVTNNIATAEHYTYAKDRLHEDSVIQKISMGDGTLTLDKMENGDTYTDKYSYYLGEVVNFQITASNYAALPYSGLRYLSDQLTEWMYIAPEEMQKLFDADEEDRKLTITLTNATLCNVSRVTDTVKNTEGSLVVLTQQQEGEITDYETNEKTKDSSMVTSIATIMFAWASSSTKTENGSWLEPPLQMVVSYDMKDSEGNVNSTIQYTKTIGDKEGDYITIEEALDDIGYVVTYGVEYSLCWDFGENFLLYGGQTLTYEYCAEVKDTFMLLTGDQPWFIVDGSEYVALAELNTVEAQNSSKETLEKDIVIASSLYRDFQLYKGEVAVLRNNVIGKNPEWEKIWLNSGTEIDASVGIQPGDVIEYVVEVLHGGGAAYFGLPLVDRLSGSQYLLIPESLNSENIDLFGLETITVQGVEYYVLSKAGTYTDVYLQEDFLAAEITVLPDNTGSLAETMIYSYLSIESDESVYVTYWSLVQRAEDSLMTEFELRNQVWLNDHETHRIYDETFQEGSIFRIDKYIVTDKGEDNNYEDDVLTKRTTVTQGEEVTYRFTLQTVGDAYVTLSGAKIWDVLPENVKGNAWTEDDILSIQFVAVNDTIIQDDDIYDLDTILEMWSVKRNGETTTGWYVTSQNPGEIEIGMTNSDTQQFLCWSDDLCITFNGTIYVYVTLKFPIGSAWQAYSSTYSVGNLENVLHVFQLKDTVFHDVEVETIAYLEKGVDETGVYSTSSSFEITTYKNISNEDARFYYENDSMTYHGYVKYYVALCNEGPNNMYLNDLQDILPEGFTCIVDITGDVTAECIDTDYTLELPTGKNAMLKTFSLEYSVEDTVNGRQKVTFHLYDYESSDNLSYDSWLDMYYLKPGEAVVFTFYVSTNGYEDTENYASNVIAMPFFDYTGGGVDVGGNVSVILGDGNDTQNYNDGNCEVQGIAWAIAQEMDISSGYNLWLSSDVTVYRTEINPGITKSTSQINVDDNTTVLWTLTVTNSGNATMTDYTITDVMEAPYMFFGDVTYKMTSPAVYAFGTSTAYRFDIDTVLFSLGDRKTENGKTTVELIYKGSNAYGNDVNTTLELNGHAVPLQCYYLASDLQEYTYDLEVSLSQDNYGNEILKIHFKDDFMAIASGGQGVLTLYTKPDDYTHESRVYYNNCYVTPNAQTFDPGTINQGNYVDNKTDNYMEEPSVRNASQIATVSGAVTSSAKMVEEINNSANKASSDASEISGTYITLADENSEFMYTLSVTNGESETGLGMSKLILIDWLPELGDTYVFGSTQRVSQFKVVLSENPNFVVKIDGIEVDGSQYMLQFSEASSFTDGDWANITTVTAWYTWDEVRDMMEAGLLSLDEIRSIRVIFHTDNTSTLLKAGVTVTVQFNAKVADDQGDLDCDGVDEHASKTDITPSAVAWNSFGYCYTILNSSTDLKAAPLKAGVQIPGAPNLVKQIQNSDGTVAIAEDDEVFYYLIYPDDVNLGSMMENWEDEAELIAALKTAGVDTYTVIEVEVLKGESESNSYSLQGLYEYSTDTSDLTGNSWKWKDGNTYTIIEIGSKLSDCEYEFFTWNSKTKTNSYTFTYSKNSNDQLLCINKRAVWSLTVTKVNEEFSMKLSDAVFGLYSKNAISLMSKDDVESKLTELASITNLKYNKISTLEIANNGNTEIWYLTDIQVTSQSGIVSWDKLLLDDEYFLVELEAPDNYSLNEEETQWYITYQGVTSYDKSVSIWSVSTIVDDNGLKDYSVYGIVANVINQYDLPQSGGIGTKLYTLTGLLLVFSAAYLKYKKLRWGGR